MVDTIPVPGIFASHSVTHRHYLAANHVVKAVNMIKYCSMNDKIFRKLCNKNNEEYERLLLPTEVRWISKGNCLDCFHSLYGTAVGCQEAVDSNFQQHISGIEHDVAYIADMFTHLKISNKMMQGDRTTFI